MSWATPNRETGADSIIPAGYTYFGQFVDHDITLDVSSTIEAVTDANDINNMRSPAMDLDSVYGLGPALTSFLYNMPSSGPGGPSGSAGMVVKTAFDLPRMTNGNTAVIGDSRNYENLIVSQFHHTIPI